MIPLELKFVGSWETYNRWTRHFSYLVAKHVLPSLRNETVKTNECSWKSVKCQKRTFEISSHYNFWPKRSFLSSYAGVFPDVLLCIDRFVMPSPPICDC